jgi:hypothetical protein
MQNAGRNQPQHEFPAVDVHRMASVVSALVACDDGKSWRDQVDDFAFAFIAPLRTENREVHIGLRFYFVTADLVIETAEAIFERAHAARVKKKKFSFSIDNVRAAS